MTALLGPTRLHHGVAWITVAACVLACVPAGLRWLRVAQREHYLAGSASRLRRAVVDGHPAECGGPRGGPGRGRPVALVAAARRGHGGRGGARARRALAKGPVVPVGLDAEAADTGPRLGRPRDRGPRGRGAGRAGRSRGRGGRARRADPGRPGLSPHLARRATARHPLRRRGRGPTGPGGAQSGGHHRLLRQDHHQGYVAHLGCRVSARSGSGVAPQFQQPGRFGPCDIG